MKYRAGVAETPTTDTAGVEGTSAMVVSFLKYVRPCYVQNVSVTALLVKVNEDDCAADDYHHSIAAGAGIDVSLDGQVNVTQLSFWAAGGTPFDTVIAHGWPP